MACAHNINFQGVIFVAEFKILRCITSCDAKIGCTPEDKERKICCSVDIKIRKGQIFYSRKVSESTKYKLFPLKYSGKTVVELDDEKIKLCKQGSWTDITDSSLVKQFKLDELLDELNELRDRYGDKPESDFSGYSVSVLAPRSGCFERIIR